MSMQVHFCNHAVEAAALRLKKAAQSQAEETESVHSAVAAVQIKLLCTDCAASSSTNDCMHTTAHSSVNADWYNL
jgi:hypothetical protein